MNEELDRIINQRVGFAYPDPGVIVSAPWQIYSLGRLDYVVPESAEDSEESFPDFDVESAVVPEGYKLVYVVNLRGGTIVLTYLEDSEDEESTTTEVSESFAAFADLENNEHFKTSFGLEGYNFDMSVPVRSGYYISGIDRNTDESEIFTVTFDWTEMEQVEGNAFKISTAAGLEGTEGVLVGMGPDFDCSTNSHAFVDGVEATIDEVIRYSNENTTIVDENGEYYFVSMSEIMKSATFKNTGSGFEFIRFISKTA